MGENLKFQQENFTYELACEAAPLLILHAQEADPTFCYNFDLDIEHYIKCSEAGIQRVFTVRKDNTLVGYAVFCIGNHPHFKKTKQALADVIFITKEMRGHAAYKFIKWIDSVLKADGFERVLHCVRHVKDFGPILKRIGYEPVETIYARKF